jgi:hypothetical protein
MNNNENIFNQLNGKEIKPLKITSAYELQT